MFKWLYRILYVVTLIAIVLLVVRGCDYYTTPYGERPRHEDYRLLRPAASWGLAYGYVGAGMMVLMLTYSLRKRTQVLGKLFSLRGWLDLHIYLGICGPLFIVLHTSFKVQGLVAVSFWSMVAVALSGFFGRYLYLQIPRNIQGDELSLKDIEQVRAIYAGQLQRDYGLSSQQIEGLDALSQGPAEAAKSVGQAVVAVLRYNLLERPRIRRRLERELRGLKLGGHRLRHLLQILEQRGQLQRRIALLSQIQRLFHYWHVVHKPFALIMYGIMLVHIGVAVWTGYGWNF